MNKIFYYNSPIGILKITINNDEIISLCTSNKFIKSKLSIFEQKILKQLDEYFLGKRTHFDIKINPSGTPFQKLVWKELTHIEYGQTKSYSEIARRINKPNSQRAVGNACNKNPILIMIPCHRVTKKNFEIGGFVIGTKAKETLLSLETKQF